MTKRIGLTVLFLLGLLVLDTRSTSQYAAQPQTQPPEHVADEVIVRFRDGVDESRKDLARFRVAGSRKMAYKSRFQPLEGYGPNGWQKLADHNNQNST